MDEQRALRLLGSPERRATLREFEVRAGSGDTFTVRGYASVVDHAYDVYGGPDRGGFTETISRGAFDTTLAAKPDVSFLINHEGMPLARTRSGTLQLRADSTGLEAEANVDRRDPFGQSLQIKMERGDLDQMSFGFRVTRQSWNEDYTERDITEVNLDHGDVSIVNIPANPATSMSIVSARAAVDLFREMELTEARAACGDISPEDLEEARERLGAIVAQMRGTSPAAIEVDVVPVLREMSKKDAREALRSIITIAISNDDDDDEEVEAGTPDAGTVTDDDDQDDQQVSDLIALLGQLIGNSDLKLTPRSAEPVVEEEREDEEEIEEREEIPEPRRASARLLRYRLIDAETRRSA